LPGERLDRRHMLVGLDAITRKQTCEMSILIAFELLPSGAPPGPKVPDMIVRRNALSDRHLRGDLCA
jgi:hypothetical protein